MGGGHTGLYTGEGQTGVYMGEGHGDHTEQRIATRPHDVNTGPVTVMALGDAASRVGHSFPTREGGF